MDCSGRPRHITSAGDFASRRCDLPTMVRSVPSFERLVRDGTAASYGMVDRLVGAGRSATLNRQNHPPRTWPTTVFSERLTVNLLLVRPGLGKLTASPRQQPHGGSFISHTYVLLPKRACVVATGKLHVVCVS